MTDAKNEYTQSKTRFKNAMKKFRIPNLACSMMNFSLRMFECLADIFLGYILIIGFAGNIIPYIAVAIANDAGVTEIISGISSSNMQSVISNLTNIFALWVFPMIVISTALGFAVIKLLTAAVKAIHKKCNEITAKNKARLEYL